MKESALHALKDIHAKYKNVTHVTMMGHSAGTTAVLKMLADGNLPRDAWIV